MNSLLPFFFEVKLFLIHSCFKAINTVFKNRDGTNFFHFQYDKTDTTKNEFSYLKIKINLFAQFLVFFHKFCVCFL